MNLVTPVTAAAPTKRPQSRAATMMAVRVWHAYAGAFFAPAILFFAVTGALQTFNLHKPQPGYRPPAVVQALASMHKNQNLHVKAADDAAPKPGKRAKAPKPDDAVPPSPIAVVAQWTLKVFAALVSAGLIATTLLGLYMSWQGPRRRAVILWFAAGLVLPMLVMLAV